MNKSKIPAHTGISALQPTQFDALNRNVGRERIEIVLKQVRTGIPAEDAEN
jgi:hypothetical protein